LVEVIAVVRHVGTKGQGHMLNFDLFVLRVKVIYTNWNGEF